MNYRSLVFLFGLSLLFIQGKKPEDYSKVLPNTVKMTDHLYYDKTEISNMSWLEYVYWNEKTYGKGSAEHLATYPDTNVWVNKLTYNQPYVRYYLTHPAYKDYPVVGVTWQQAVDFCAWRTERVREVLEETNKLDKAPLYFNYRLPTKDEFMLVYDEVGSLLLRIGEEGPKRFRGMHRFNLRRAEGDTLGVAGKDNDNADVTAPTIRYWPSESGVYNIKGNVAEWLLDANTYSGGDWNTRVEADASELKSLQGTSATVGFRCACEVANEAP